MSTSAVYIVLIEHIDFIAFHFYILSPRKRFAVASPQSEKTPDQLFKKKNWEIRLQYSGIFKFRAEENISGLLSWIYM